MLIDVPDTTLPTPWSITPSPLLNIGSRVVVSPSVNGDCPTVKLAIAGGVPPNVGPEVC